jgi:hypothetical protein
MLLGCVAFRAADPLRATTVGEEHAEDCSDHAKPPVIVSGTRAGHGPGIGGFARATGR